MCDYILDGFIGSFKNGVMSFITHGMRWPYTMQLRVFVNIPAMDNFALAMPNAVLAALEIHSKMGEINTNDSSQEWVALMEMISCDLMVYLEQSPVLINGGTPEQRRELLCNYSDYLYRQLLTRPTLLH